MTEKACKRCNGKKIIFNENKETINLGWFSMTCPDCDGSGKEENWVRCRCGDCQADTINKDYKCSWCKEGNHQNHITLRQKIYIRRFSDRTEESARKRSQKLVKKYGFKILDEFIFGSLHILLTDLNRTQIEQIRKEPMVQDVSDPPRLTLN